MQGVKPEIGDFTIEALNQYVEKITDNLFAFIDDNKELNLKYLDLVSKNSKGTVNSQIGRAIYELLVVKGLKKKNAKDSSSANSIKSNELYELNI